MWGILWYIWYFKFIFFFESICIFYIFIINKFDNIWFFWIVFVFKWNLVILFNIKINIFVNYGIIIKNWNIFKFYKFIFMINKLGNF